MHTGQVSVRIPTELFSAAPVFCLWNKYVESRKTGRQETQSCGKNKETHFEAFHDKCKSDIFWILMNYWIWDII